MIKIKKLKQGYKIYFENYPSVCVETLEHAKELIRLRDLKKYLFIPWINNTHYVIELW